MARLHDILSYAQDSVVPTLITDAAIRTTYANSAFTRLSGFQLEDVLGKKPGDFLRGRNSCNDSRECFHKGIRDLVPFEVKVKNYRKDTSEEYIAGIYVLPVRDSEKSDRSFFVALERELESSEEEILADDQFSEALSSLVDLLTGSEA